MKDRQSIIDFIDEKTGGDKSGVYLAFSGGKDSMVLFDAVTRWYPDVPIIHNPKKETHNLTKKFMYKLSIKNNIYNVPLANMNKIIEMNGFTTQIDGTRRSEFTRTEKSNDVVIGGVSVSRENMPDTVVNGLFGINHIYPIIGWEDEDVYNYIRSYDVDYSMEYVENGELP